MEMNQLLNIEFDMDDVQVNTSTVFSYNMESIDGGDKAIVILVFSFCDIALQYSQELIKVVVHIGLEL